MTVEACRDGWACRHRWPSWRRGWDAVHPFVVAELDLARHGFAVTLLDPGLWRPFDDGTSVALVVRPGAHDHPPGRRRDAVATDG
jgi:hypothetical protein